MTRNRGGAHRPPQHGDGFAYHPVGGLLTLLLVAPAAAVLTSRLRGLLDLDQGSGGECTGAAVIWSVLHHGLPAVAMVIVIPVALLSLAHRARGWMWLAAALLGTVVLEVALRLWAPGCL